MSSDLVTIDSNNGIADVRLNRDEKYNALSQDLFDAIIDAGQSLASADHVSAVVLSGNGRGFCAGLDMASFASMSDGSRQSQSGTVSVEERRTPGKSRSTPGFGVEATAYAGHCIAAWRRVWWRVPTPSAPTYVLRHRT